MAQKRCLYISTLGIGDSPPSNAAEVIYEKLILPIIRIDFPDFDIVRYQFEQIHGSINERVLEEVLSTDLVIADLTELTSNGFYELGVRHAAQLPTILMAQVGQPLPFDIQDFSLCYLSILFDRRRDGAEDARGAHRGNQRRPPGTSGVARF
jgi:hypothetical protein